MRSGGRSLLAALLATLLAAAPLVGCAGQGQGSQTGTETLTYWATNEASSVQTDQKIYDRIIADFEKRHDVEVKVTVVPWANLYKKILTATTSGQGPDVVNIGNTWSASLQATGAFVEFDEETMAEIGGKEKFVSTPLESAGAPGKTPTAVPLYLLPDPVLYYNKQLLDEAGVDGPPGTWSEFNAVAGKLTRDTNGNGEVDQHGFAFAGTDWYTMVHRAYVLSKQTGGQYFDDSGSPTFARPQNVQAVERIVDLVQQGSTSPEVAEYQGTDVVADFANGKIGMMMRPLNALAALEERDMDRDEFGVAMRPVPGSSSGGEPYRGYLSGTNISIFASTDNEDLALQFVDFMTSKKQQIAFANEYGDGYLPVTKEAFNSNSYGGQYREVGTEVATKSVAMPQVPGEADMENFVGNAVVDLVRQAATGQQVSTGDIKGALREANQKMTAGDE